MVRQMDNRTCSTSEKTFSVLCSTHCLCELFRMLKVNLVDSWSWPFVSCSSLVHLLSRLAVQPSSILPSCKFQALSLRPLFGILNVSFFDSRSWPLVLCWPLILCPVNPILGLCLKYSYPVIALDSELSRSRWSSVGAWLRILSLAS